MRTKHLVIPLLSLSALMGLVAGCSRDATPVSADVRDGAMLASTSASGAEAPTNLVSVSYGGETLSLWPYLTPDGSRPEDPVNLVFTGAASAIQIRAALLALDGNRTPTFPDVYPFNATWSDGMGGTQAGYAEGAGWIGSVIQLQLGGYGPVRVHLRLYQTGLPFGDGGEWTLGGAHFEIQIPGTPEHQVLSWELAEQIVAFDLARTGLLQAAPAASAGINDAPGYRAIPPAIYNGVPDGLKVACGLPTGPSATPVPIPTNGHATILKLGAGPADAGNGGHELLTVQFQQVIPKPFCASGPADYFLVEGPVDLVKDVRIDGEGRYSYRYELSGHLTATPFGGGESFGVRVHDIQSGFLDDNNAALNARAQRIAPQDGGTELLMQWLNVGTNGQSAFRSSEHCLID